MDAYKVQEAEIQKDIANIKSGLPKTTSSADSVMRTIDDILKHPGFSDVIGVPNVLTGIYSPPGTKARDFKSKFRQLEGQAFLQAFETLKGGGAITEREGQAATQAIAALTDPGISEAEFIRNSEIFKNSVKRMVNRQREAAGLPRLEKYEPGTPQDRAAAKWADEHPDDPRSAKIRETLTNKGFY